MEDNAEIYDIAFIGAGLSTAHTLSCILKNQLSSPFGCLRVVVYEKTTDWFKGVAYGNRTGSEGLLINTLGELLQSDEYEPFKLWVAENRAQIVEDISRIRFGRKWLDKYMAQLIDGDISSLYIPRFIFGQYTSQTVNSLISAATRSGLAEVTRVQGEVIEITKERELFEIFSYRQGDVLKRQFSSKIVLAIGSPPFKNLSIGTKAKVSSSLTTYYQSYVINPFQIGMEKALDIVEQGLVHAHQGDRHNIVIVGSNASALDVVYNISSNPAIVEHVNEIYVLSQSGEMPTLFDESDQHKSAWLASDLLSLTEQADIQASDILKAATSDIRHAQASGEPSAVSIVRISRVILELVEKLDAEQLKLFASHVGNEIGALQRRVGWEYHEQYTYMARMKKIRNVAGRYVGLREYSTGTCSVEFIPEGSPTMKISNVSNVINCTGFQKLGKNCSDELIRNVVSSGLCSINASGRGFEVNDNFETTEYFYVLGPMLAGNVISGVPIWHMEHAGRIMKCANTLSTILLGRSKTILATSSELASSERR